jgi:hypothetical protein
VPARRCWSPGAGPRSAPSMASAPRSGPPTATAIGPGTGIPGWARSSWRSRGCVLGVSCRRSWSRAGGPSGPWPRWSPVPGGGRVHPPGRRRRPRHGHRGISKSQVSRRWAELDDVVAAWPSRPWTPAGPCWCGGTRWWSRSARVVGSPPPPRWWPPAGPPTATARSSGWRWRRAWTACLRSLVARGLGGVNLVVSDAHCGPKDAVAAVLEGACGQRCRPHFMRDLLVKVPRHAQPMVASLVRTILAQQRPQDARARLGRVVQPLRGGRFGDPAGLLEAAAADVLADSAFPPELWKHCWSNSPQARLNKSAAAARRWSGSSRAATRSSAWSVPCWPSGMTSGRSAAASWPSRRSRPA